MYLSIFKSPFIFEELKVSYLEKVLKYVNSESREIGQLIKCTQDKHEFLSSHLQHPCWKNQNPLIGTATQARNHSKHWWCREPGAPGSSLVSQSVETVSVGSVRVLSERKKQVEGSRKDTQPQAYTQAHVHVHIDTPILASTLHTTLVMYTNVFKYVNTFVF